MALYRPYNGRIKAVKRPYKGRIKATAILPFCLLLILKYLFAVVGMLNETFVIIETHVFQSIVVTEYLLENGYGKEISTRIAQTATLEVLLPKPYVSLWKYKGDDFHPFY